MAGSLKAVFFDLDGTLLDTSEDLGHALNQVRREQGLNNIPQSIIREQVSNGATALIKLGFGPLDEEVLLPLRQRLLDMYLQHIALHTKPFDGMEELIERLTLHEIAWGIVTNKPHLYTTELMRSFEFASTPCVTVSPDQVGVGKPNPAGLLYACEAAGCTPEEAIYIGDHQRDIECGHNAGMPTIAVGYGFTGHADEHRTWNATHVADQVADIWLIITTYLNHTAEHD